jgi:hypothetical protein
MGCNCCKQALALTTPVGAWFVKWPMLQQESERLPRFEPMSTRKTGVQLTLAWHVE